MQSTEGMKLNGEIIRIHFQSERNNSFNKGK